MEKYIKNFATISDCGKYRYLLIRKWDESKPDAMFIMLNPSTADGEKDDPTIRRCVGFAKSWGYGGIMVVNLFAFRATNPKDLFSPEDPIGEENLMWIRLASEQSELVICAWGNGKLVDKLSKGYKPLSVVSKTLMHLGLCNDGTPRHPLYLRGDIFPNTFAINMIKYG